MNSYPARFTQVSVQYSEDLSTVDRWLATRVQRSTTHLTSATELYDDYVDFTPGQPVSQKMFGMRLAASGVLKLRSARGYGYALVEKKEQGQ